jgi:hypothetical protein
LIRSIWTSTIFLPISLPPKHSLVVSKVRIHKTKYEIPTRRTERWELTGTVAPRFLSLSSRDSTFGSEERRGGEIRTLGVLLEEAGQDRSVCRPATTCDEEN